MLEILLTDRSFTQGKSMSEKSRLTILQYLTCTCRDNGKKITDDLKLRRIEELLRQTNSPYKAVATGKLFRLYGRTPVESQDNVVVISAHADIVNGIKEPWVEQKGNLLYGTFDNAAGDACAAILMYENVLPDNVFVAFTMNEEAGMRGAKEVSKYFKSINKEFGAVVLDVTDVGFGKGVDFTVENDYWSESFGLSVIGIAERMGRYAFVPNTRKKDLSYVPKERYMGFGMPDEAWAYKREGVQTCSLCIPTRGEMHDDSGLAMSKSSYMKYINAVGNITTVLSRNRFIMQEQDLSL